MVAEGEDTALALVQRRVWEKAKSYRRYHFSDGQNAALRAFFDLAQEYDVMEDFCRVCVVAAPGLFGNPLSAVSPGRRA
ncbi:MAG: hypothetical protein U5J62_10400 [Desulfurivibrio sp.]|nr:hypothetical protein [Desulfurivibrio sp.]